MKKWDVVRIYCEFLTNPHDKFCVCICPKTNLFFFINSDPPQFRKASTLAITIDNFEATFISHTSYLDTTKLVQIPEAAVKRALSEPARNHGCVSPTLNKKIKNGVGAHEVMEPLHRDKVLAD